jgi:hypothetical protein
MRLQMWCYGELMYLLCRANNPLKRYDYGWITAPSHMVRSGDDHVPASQPKGSFTLQHLGPGSDRGKVLRLIHRLLGLRSGIRPRVPGVPPPHPAPLVLPERYCVCVLKMSSLSQIDMYPPLPMGQVKLYQIKPKRFIIRGLTQRGPLPREPAPPSEFDP